MNKYFIFTICSLFTFFSCKNDKTQICSSSNSEIHVFTSEPNNNINLDKQKDTITDESQQKEYIIIIEKIKNNKILNNTDYDNLAHFLLENNDESFSEEMGSVLFDFLKKTRVIIKPFLFFEGKNL